MQECALLPVQMIYASDSDTSCHKTESLFETDFEPAQLIPPL